ncbi:hypothetical protein GC173_14460 [bacterium]|nr:hypothetical protein [bacterium]
MRHLAKALLLVVALASVGRAQDAEADGVVSAAVRASLLGRASEVRGLASAQRSAEQEATDGKRPPRIAENIMLLAVATEQPTPTLKETRESLKGYARDGSTRVFERLVRFNEPRQRYLEARADRRYESRRFVFNALASPVAGLAQGQFFPLFALPFDMAKWVFVGRPFATPEERRELRTARTLAQRLPTDPLAAKAMKDTEKLSDKRKRLAVAEARMNADRALEGDRRTAAHYWYGRELKLLDDTVPVAQGHRDLLIADARRTARGNERVTVLDGERNLGSTAEVSVYTSLCRALLVGDRSVYTKALGELRVGWPGSVAIDAAAAGEAALSHVGGDGPLAMVLLENLKDYASTSVGSMSSEVLNLPSYDPEPTLKLAEAAASRRRRLYIWTGRDPQIVDRSLVGEEVRLARGSVIDRARVLFVTDALARLIFLPLADPMPRPELLAASARTDPQWMGAAENNHWLKAWVRALRNERRHEDVARLWDLYAEPERAAKARERAARHLEKIASRTESWMRRASIYTRILTGYPVYTKRARVADLLSDAERLAAARVVITRDELRRWPELLGTQGLDLEASLVDGTKSNGEVGEAGLLLLPGGLVAWKDRGTKRWIERGVSPERIDGTMRLLEPRRRTDALRTETARPLPRKKIPLAFEAGVYPGFEIAPGLVPLEPDAKDRRLYE